MTTEDTTNSTGCGEVTSITAKRIAMIASSTFAPCEWAGVGAPAMDK